MFLSRPSKPVSVRKANPNHGKDGRFVSGSGGGASVGPEKVRWHRDVRTREGWKKGDESLLSAGKVSPTNGVAGGSTGHPYVAYVPKRHDASDSRVVIYGYKSYHYNPKGNVETTRYRLFMGDKEIAVSDTFSALRERMYSTIAQKEKSGL